MNSAYSVFDEEEGAGPPYPIAPVEVQAYTWAGLSAWGGYFSRERGEDDRALGAQCLSRAAALKKKFNEKFVLTKPFGVAFAIDGMGEKLTSVRSSMGRILWAAFASECILDEQYIEPLRHRLLARDLFVPTAGIRTLSSRCCHYDPLSYHNGSIWPHDTALVAEGLENFGFAEDAARVRAALRSAYVHFKTPIELYSYRRGFRKYKHKSGAGACRTQAWSAAALLSISQSGD